MIRIRRSSLDRPEPDFLDPNLYQAAPHELWRWMRAHEPVYRDDRNGLWAVTLHRDVRDVERRSSVFVTDHGYRPVVAMEEQSLIALDDPVHRQRRAIVQPYFTTKEVASLRTWIGGTVDELLAAVIDAGRCDVVADLAAPLAGRLTCRLLGFDEEMSAELVSWSERLMRMDMRDRDGGVYADFHDAANEVARAARSVAINRAGCPQHDLISEWVSALQTVEGFTPESFVHELLLFISGGAETTRTAISHGMREFVEHPGHWNRLACADEAELRLAVEEVLRWVSPLNNMFRRAAVDTEIGDTAIRKGDRVMLLYPSANRDESVFDAPDAFHPLRDPNPHLAFGFGTHLCLGATLARATLLEFFSRASKQITGLGVATEIEVEANIFARAVSTFGLSFEPRAPRAGV